MDGFRFPAPFPGLHAFEPTQTDLFFGRDAEVRQLIEKLSAQRLVGVVGISGIGKSSLIRAGLIPRLAQGYMSDGRTQWRTVVVKPGSAPLTALARRLSECFGLSESDVASVLGHSSRGLLRLAADHLDSGENLFILVDQFEELMRFSADSAPQRELATEFVDLLLGATGHSPIEPEGEKKPQIFIVLTMRSEFLGKCTRFPGLAEALNDGQFLVPRLERNQLKAAIEGPVTMVGERISPALVQQLLNDAANEIDQLPLIEFALARIWDISGADRANGRALGLEHYEAVGSSIVTALNRAADAAIEALKQRDPRNGNAIRKLFQRLAEPRAADDEVRRPAPLSELAAVAECEVAEIKPLVEELARHGFLTISGDDDPEIDITHESLIRRWDTLDAWVKEEATSADIYRRLADAAIRRGSPYRGRDLDEALKWRSQYHPTSAWAARYSVANESFEVAMAFLKLSRRRRWWFAGLFWAASCAIVAAGVAVLYLAREQRIAEHQRIMAEQQRIMAEQQQSIVEQQRSIAEEQRSIAEKQRSIAEEKNIQLEQSLEVLRQSQAEAGALLTSEVPAEKILSQIEKTTDPFKLALLVEGLVQRPTLTSRDAFRALLSLTNALKRSSDRTARIVVASAIATLVPRLKQSRDDEGVIASLIDEARNESDLLVRENIIDATRQLPISIDQNRILRDLSKPSDKPDVPAGNANNTVSCEGAIWLGSGSPVFIKIPGKPGPVEPQDIQRGRKFVTTDYLKLRRSVPDHATYKHQDILGTVAPNTEVEALGVPEQFPRPAGTQYWLAVKAPEKVCNP